MRTSRWGAYLLFSWDTLGIALSFLAARWLREGREDILFLKQGEFLGLGVVILCVFALFDLYKTNGDLLIRGPGARRLFGALLALVPAISLYAMMLPPEGRGVLFGRGILAIFLGLFALWSLLSRFLSHRYFHKKKAPSQWLVIDDGHRRQHLLKQWERGRHFGMDFFFVGGKEEQEYGPRDLGHSGHIVEAIGSRPWDGLIVCDGTPLEKEVARTIMNYRLSGKFVCRLSDFYESLWSKVPHFFIQDQWFMFSSGFHLLHNKLLLKLKRLVDIVLSLGLLLLFLPLWPLTALLIKLESGGPVLYTQMRVGLGGRPFTILKFRSMEDRGKDKCVTGIGRWMRFIHWDELPQLVNILQGEMSFIGPRPEQLALIETMERAIPFYNARHTVRPGLTGLAQVLCPHGPSVENAREKLQYDLYYIKNFSFYLDLIILLKTIRVVLLERG